MKALASAAALLIGVAAEGAVRAQTAEPFQPADPASRAEQAREAAMGAMGHHARTYTFVGVEADYARPDDEDEFSWEGDAWIGGDRNKLWFKTEGEVHDGEAEEAELQALYSRTISTFFDAQAGVRYDFEPEGTGYLTVGMKGLAPYQFETDAQVFLSEEGDLSVRLEQSLDLLLTQRWILEPEIEVNLQADDVPERDLGAGFTDVEAALQLRYEVTRKFAPYVEVRYERLLGETSAIARRLGDDPEATTLRVGLRSWF